MNDVIRYRVSWVNPYGDWKSLSFTTLGAARDWYDYLIDVGFKEVKEIEVVKVGSNPLDL